MDKLDIAHAAAEGGEGVSKFVPLYYRIAADVVSRIRSGDLAVGDRIPSEAEIRSACNVSSTTARKALAELEKEGWIKKEKGRGSFVGQPRIDRNIARITSFTHNMEQMGMRPETKVILKQAHTDNDLTLEVGKEEYTLEAPYLHIVRLRLGDGTPIMLENRFISLDLCPGLEEQDLNQSLFAMYENVYGCILLNSRQSISAISIDAKSAHRLECTPGMPGLLVEGALLVTGNRLLELERSVYRGDRYRFLIEATK